MNTTDLNRRIAEVKGVFISNGVNDYSTPELNRELVIDLLNKHWRLERNNTKYCWVLLSNICHEDLSIVTMLAWLKEFEK